MKMIAVITGANRGLGAETSRELARRGFTVLLLGRNLPQLERVAGEIRREKGEAHVFSLDVTSSDQVEKLAHEIREKFGRLHVLVNNAGQFLEGKQDGSGALTSSPDLVRATFEVNALGPLRLCQALAPLMAEGGNIVNVSSGMGQLSEMSGGWPGYRMSKTALNAFTRILADELKGSRVKVNAVCPGWVRTEMGGPQAERSVEEGVRGIVWAATLGKDGPSGGFFRDGKPIDW